MAPILAIAVGRDRRVGGCQDSFGGWGLHRALLVGELELSTMSCRTWAISSSELAEADTSSTWALISSALADTSSTEAEFSSLTLAMFSIDWVTSLELADISRLQPCFLQSRPRRFRPHRPVR